MPFGAPSGDPVRVLFRFGKNAVSLFVDGLRVAVIGPNVLFSLVMTKRVSGAASASGAAPSTVARVGYEIMEYAEPLREAKGALVVEDRWNADVAQVLRCRWRVGVSGRGDEDKADGEKGVERMVCRRGGGQSGIYPIESVNN